MPQALTYPGVYVEEVPSGVHTIVGVPTSVAAFVGRALKGQIDSPAVINSFDDFVRLFGDIWAPSGLGYAVNAFFQNGGGQAVVVRLFRASAGEGTDTASFKVGSLTLDAASPGRWARWLRISLDGAVSADVAKSLNLDPKDLFNLTVRDTAPGGITERFTNVTVKESKRRIDSMLKTSTLLRAGDLTGVASPNTAAYQTAVLDWEKKKADPATTAADLKAAEDKVAGLLKDVTDAVSEAERVLRAKKKASPGSDTSAEEKAVSDALDKVGGRDGQELSKDTFLAQGDKKGLYALKNADIFNILCIPPYLGGATGDVDVEVVGAAATFCETRRAFYLVDPPADWTSKDIAKQAVNDTALDHIGTRSGNAALYFPRLRQPDVKRDGLIDDFAPGGAVAGIFARTDARRGVWKAPAGLETAFSGVRELAVNLTDAENGELNPLGINCLRSLPASGRVVWGARTLQGDDRLASEWKYVPVRRLALFIEESLFRGTQWVVFEPNDEPLWAQIRLNVGAFMHTLFLQGAFKGQSAKEAYFVECGPRTTTQNDINLGIVNINVGFAPLKPAEFVVIRIQQIAGEIPT